MLPGNLNDDPLRRLGRLCPVDMSTRGFDLFLQARKIHIHMFNGMQTDVGANFA